MAPSAPEIEITNALVATALQQYSIDTPFGKLAFWGLL